MTLRSKSEIDVRQERIRARIRSAVKLELDEFYVRAVAEAEKRASALYDDDMPREFDRTVVDKAVRAGLDYIGLENVGVQLADSGDATERPAITSA